MSRLVEDFFAFLHVERGMSSHTLDAYRRDIGALIAWGGNRQWVRLLRWMRAQLQAFVSAEHRRGLSAKSLQQRRC